jgi:hypothetical protein
MFHNVFEKFSRSFVIFLVFFVAQIVILDFLELFLAMILNNSENKKNPILNQIDSNHTYIHIYIFFTF